MPLRLLLLKNKTVPADAYEHAFAAGGHTPEFVPLLDHTPVDLQETARYLTSAAFLDTSHFIITSQRAVEALHACLGAIAAREPATAAQIRAKCGYTVGPATEQILRDNGFTDVRGGAAAGNGAKLSDIIIADRRRDGGRGPVVFFTGAIRKDIIPVKLKAHGVPVHELVIYKTEPKRGIIDNFVARCARPVDWVVFFSPQGTEDIVAHVRRHGVAARIASIGPTTEEYLLSRGLVPDVVAAQPTAASLYESIERAERDAETGEASK